VLHRAVTRNFKGVADTARRLGYRISNIDGRTGSSECLPPARSTPLRRRWTRRAGECSH
jgi:hypothetical protein